MTTFDRSLEDVVSEMRELIERAENGGVSMLEFMQVINHGNLLLLLSDRDRLIDALAEAEKGSHTLWKCRARHGYHIDPVDCDWPGCGCDPCANEVMERLEEHMNETGWYSPDAADELRDDIAALRSRIEELEEALTDIIEAVDDRWLAESHAASTPDDPRHTDAVIDNAKRGVDALNRARSLLSPDSGE